ncbi:hypothetical protein [Pseudaquabacterium rugosum]|jgi:hypothetical protein|uniref:DUF4386 domain-containing protein n=1 Tax=Pseudaquabacterium rugosum TaxID=2984194 RepID=A0ABU9B6G2_9BURK
MSTSSARNPLIALRRRGAAGGVILPHRSIWSLNLPGRRLAIGLALTLLFTLLLSLAKPWISLFWVEQMREWMQALGLAQQIGVDDAVPSSQGQYLLSLPVPMVHLQMPAPVRPLLMIHGGVAVLAWLAVGFLPDAGRPATYLVRFAAMIHLCAVVFFAFWAPVFPHDETGHIAWGLHRNWLFMLLTPWLHLFTYYMFPFPWWQRIALTGLTVGWLALLGPLQFALHAQALAVFGIVVMPLLETLAGVMLPILGMVALFGWAMSWNDPEDLQG